MKQLPLGVRLRAHAVFANFVTAGNGELVARLAGASREPLWLWGAPGCGKTHLLQAVCAAAGEAAAYFPLNGTPALPPEALKGFENCRVLCLDDVDRAAGKLEWERALFRLFNEAAELGSRVVFAARTAPRQAPWQLDDWRSRAASCVVYQVRELEEGERAEALRLRAAQRGLDLAPETLDYMMRRMPRDLPSLFEILDELDNASMVAQRRLTIPFIREALEKRAKTEP